MSGLMSLTADPDGPPYRAGISVFDVMTGLQLVGQGAAATLTIRHPLEFSASPLRYDLPPPGLDEHGSQIREWLTTGVAT
jgi:crotonobetainyl-CoA:carnitine CoA-transferase CaiB-like acyl-CoA transferase